MADSSNQGVVGDTLSHSATDAAIKRFRAERSEPSETARYDAIHGRTL